MEAKNGINNWLTSILQSFNKDADWRKNNCTTYVCDEWLRVTGEYLSPYDYLNTAHTPDALADSIDAANNPPQNSHETPYVDPIYGPEIYQGQYL